MDGNYSVMSDRGCSYHFTTGVFLTIANIITTILGTFFNVLILVSSSRLHSVSNLFIINLTIADLLVCAAALPLNSVWTVQKTHGICVSQGVLYSRRVLFFTSQHGAFESFLPLPGRVRWCMAPLLHSTTMLSLRFFQRRQLWLVLLSLQHVTYTSLSLFGGKEEVKPNFKEVSTRAKHWRNKWLRLWLW